MATTNAKGTFQPDSDIHILFEDQQKINKFARLNAKLEDLKEEIRKKENDFKNLEDACDEVALMDSDTKVPYLVGEVYIFQNVEKIQEYLEEGKKEIEDQLFVYREESEKVIELMADLKNHLYGKFGNHIHLEPDE